MALIPVNFGGGSGSGSDDCTAKAEHVLAPYTAITSDSDDEPIEGTLQDKSGTAQQATTSLDATNSRLQMTVPATGKYSTSSKLYAAYSAIQSLIGLTADKLWTGVSILGLASSRTALGAKTYTPGTANQTISSGICLTGAQTIKGDSNLKAANIKKGVTIFGITGTWEGYVAGATDLYYMGVNAAGFSVEDASTNAKCSFMNTYMELDSGGNGTSHYTKLTAKKAFSFVGYSKLNIKYKSTAGTTSMTFQLWNGSTRVASASATVSALNTEYTASIDISSYQNSLTPSVRVFTNNNTIQISRIYLS